MNGQFRITEMFAFTAIDDDGTEGVIGMMTPDGWAPFVGADIARIQSLRPHAEEVARLTGKEIKLKKFLLQDTLEVIGGKHG
jgi:hypothetical protein